MCEKPLATASTDAAPHLTAALRLERISPAPFVSGYDSTMSGRSRVLADIDFALSDLSIFGTADRLEGAVFASAESSDRVRIEDEGNGYPAELPRRLDAASI